jgi:DNA repair exonuclease SbcCD ATPase subunit
VAEHADALESKTKELEKKLSSQNLELKATQDDLSKAKASLNASRIEVENLIAQRDEARAEAAAAAAGPAPPDHSAEIEALTKQLANSKDDQVALVEQLSLTKASLTDMSDNHMKELEQAAQGRAEEVTKLRTAHEEEVTALAQQKSEMLLKLSDLEGELATLKASIGTESAASLKSNGAAHPSSPGVTKEELQRMYEAHNLKLHDIQAEHERDLKALKDGLEASVTKSEELQQEVARKAMEIQYLEQENEDSQDQITRCVETSLIIKVE